MNIVGNHTKERELNNEISIKGTRDGATYPFLHNISPCPGEFVE
jgi:hypothetical protein